MPSRPTTLPPRDNVAALADAKRRGDPEFPGFRLADSPLYLIVRAAGRYSREMESHLRASGVDLMSWRALMIVDEASPSSVSEIAERSVTRLSTMTRVVQRLESKRLVKLSRSQTDARVTEVSITPLGRRSVERQRGTAGATYRHALRDISPAEIQVLNRLMRRIFGNLSDPAQNRRRSRGRNVGPEKQPERLEGGS